MNRIKTHLKIPNINKKELLLILVGLLILNPVFGLDISTKLIGSDVLNDLGLDGKNNTICLVDTGVDYTHENLGNCNDINDCDRILGGYDYHSDDSDPIDTSGHGTEVAGIIFSNHSKFRGVAPGVNIVILRALNYTGGTWSALNKSVAWCVNNRLTYNITIVSMSLGDSDPHTSANCDDYADIQSKINEGVANGISFIAASGNEGSTNGINYPACLPNVTSVGSINNKEEVARHSNRFNNLDLLAPGVGIKTTKMGGGLSAGRTKDFICGFSDPISGDFWTYCDDMYGTSYATPHIAGAFALIRQHDTAMKSNDIERLLKNSGKKVYDSSTGLNFSRIDLLSALNVLDWPTFHHDNRRTGFTLLKGDIESASKKTYGFALSGGITSTALARPSIADVNNNGNQNIIISFSKTGSIADGYISNYEYEKKWRLIKVGV